MFHPTRSEFAFDISIREGWEHPPLSPDHPGVRRRACCGDQGSGLRYPTDALGHVAGAHARCLRPRLSVVASRYQRIGASGLDRMPAACWSAAALSTQKAGLGALGRVFGRPSIRREFKARQRLILGLAEGLESIDLTAHFTGGIGETA